MAFNSGESRGPSSGGPSSGGSRERRPMRREGGGKFFKGKKKHCRFCADGTSVDYKNVALLRTFTTERAKIMPRRSTGNCARHQRQLTTAVRRARVLALIPFSND
ncbi:MAG: 30S ribosomal protein S18 [Candidatus Firestonebacteria bacterium]